MYLYRVSVRGVGAGICPPPLKYLQLIKKLIHCPSKLRDTLLLPPLKKISK